MLAIYSDCSTSINGSCVAFLVFDFKKDLFIGSGTKRYKVNKSSVCEAFAVRDALKYLHERNLLSNQDIRVFTDFAHSKKQWNRHQQGADIKSSVFQDIIGLSKHCSSFDINYVKSHVNSNTPNKACDILARRYRQ